MRMSPLSRWNGPGLVRCKIKHAQESGAWRCSFSIRPVALLEQVGWVVAGTHELSGSVRAHAKEKERDELERKGLFAKKLADAVQRFGAGSVPGAKFHIQRAQHHRAKQGGGHSLCRRRRPASPIRLSRNAQPQKVVEISSHIACGTVKRVDAEVLKLQQGARQKTLLSLLRQG